MTARLRTLLRDDRGLTLSELIVASIVTVLVLITAGGLYISTVQTQRTVVNLSEPATSAQLVARSIDMGVRNGVIVKPLVTGLDGGQLLVVCSAGTDPAGAAYSWRAWYYSPVGNGQLRTQTFASNAAPAAPNAAALSGWSLLLDGVKTLPDPATGVDSGEVFSIDSGSSQVSLRFSSFGGDVDSTTIEFATNPAPHPTYAPGSEPCT